MKKVGFIINFSPNKWLGGYNYIYNLFFFLKKFKINSIKPIIITNNKNYFKKPYNIDGVKIIENKILNKNTFVKSILNKLQIILLGKNLAFENFLIKNKIEAISHFEFTGRKSTIKSFPWFPDFQEIHLPKNFSFKQRTLRFLNLYLAYRNSSKIIISSNSVLNDLRKINKKYLNKVILLKHAVNISKIPTFSESEKILKKYGIRKKFFYLPNHFWKHKNHIIVLKALKILKERNNIDFIIVCTGNFNDHRDYSHTDYLKKYISNNNLEDFFLYIGIVPFEVLVSLILHSIALINPSKSEGWSNTIEQAKALGKKVIASKIPTHLEQKSNNFYFFNYNSEKQLSKLLHHNSKKFKKVRNFSINKKNYSKYEISQKKFIKNFEKIFLKHLKK